MNLLDVNVLIALVDRSHVHHSVCKEWFLGNQREGWVTCPITENGFVRILGHPSYFEGPGTTRHSRELLMELCREAGHSFWPDSVSIRSLDAFPLVPAPKGLTDAYLLALAVSRGGRFVSLDRRIDPSFVTGGKESLLLLG